jgi:RHS repeat-associated protein
VANNLGTTSYGFVGQSNRPSVVDYANGMETQYDYYTSTGDFLLKQIKNLTAGPTRTVISQFDYTYGADRSIATWGVDQGSGAKTWTFGYDGARELTTATLRDGSQTLLEANTYGYDKAGNRIQVGTGTTAPKNYETNKLNQLLSERDYGRTTFAGVVDEPATVKVNGKPSKVLTTDGGAPFKFEALVDLDAGANTVVVEAKDGQNNTSTKTYSVTTTGTSKKYEYDANGNLRYEKQPDNTVVREYRWDQQNRLVRMLEGTHESVYEYDGASRRWRITEKESGTQTKQEIFIWCGARICQKRASNGSTVIRSYFGNGFEESGTTDYFYTRDHLGSVREVVGSDGMTIGSTVSYDPWGVGTETGSVLPDFGYTGHYLDRPSGLALTRYRGYGPGFGRWLSRDPLGLVGGPNLYGYVGNRPVNLRDPDGRYAVGGGVGAAAGTGVGGAWGGLVLAGGAIIGAAAWDILHQIDDYQHPAVGGPDPKPGPARGPKPGPGPSPAPGPGGGPGAGPGGGGGGPYRDPPPSPGPQYPECGGMGIAETNTCCRQATGYRGDFDGDECDPARQNYDDCMSENGW